MYIFLSKDKKKLCARPSIIGLPSTVKTKIIRDSWKREIFGSLWSINISDLKKSYKEIPEIKELLRNRLGEEVISKPEFVETCFCENCGIPLNESGTCPICDDGEEDY